MTTPRQRAERAWHDRPVGACRTTIIDRIEAEIKGALAAWTREHEDFVAWARECMAHDVRDLKAARQAAEAARRLLIDANPLIFGADGMIDHGKPLLEVAKLAAERIEHLSNLHHEAVLQLEGAFTDGWKAAEEHHGIKKAP